MTNWRGGMTLGVDIKDVMQVRAMIASTAHKMLRGDCPYIEGARAICDLLHHAGVDRFTAPFVPFVGVESETDDVPVGHVRDSWHPEAKVKLEKTWADAERYAKTFLEPACHNLIDWLSDHPL